MENADLDNNKGTLKEQFDYWASKEQLSHVMQDGDGSYQFNSLNEVIRIGNMTTINMFNAEKARDPLRYANKWDAVTLLHDGPLPWNEPIENRGHFQQGIEAQRAVNLYIQSIAFLLVC